MRFLVFSVFALVVLSASTVFAQSAPMELQIYFSGGDFMNFAKPDDLNKFLKRNNLVQLSDNTNSLAFGSGLRFFYNDFMVGLEGTSYDWEDGKSKGDYKVSYSSGTGSLDFGYALVRLGSFKLIPIIGIGGYGVDYDIYNKNRVTFDKMLRDPGRGSGFSGGGAMLRGGLNAQYVHKFFDWGGLLIGAGATYNKSVYKTYWYETGGHGRDGHGGDDGNDLELKNGPDYKLSAVDMKVDLGWAFTF